MRRSNDHNNEVQAFDGYVEHEQAYSCRRDDEAALPAASKWAQITLNSIGDGVVTTDLACRVTYLNRAAETLTGWSCADALGKPLTQVLKLIDGETQEAATNPGQRAMEENRTVGLAMDCVLIRKDGSQLRIDDSAAPIQDGDGRLQGAVIVFHDASHSPVHSSKLAYQAHHDALTELPNRVLLSERLSRAIGLAKRHRFQVALLYLDLDDFKTINDSLGHAIGDILLQLVADRLSECVRDTDTVCRQGGDEFVVLLGEIKKPEDATRVAEKILAALVEPYLIYQHELHITASIGISLYPDHGKDEPTLLNNADKAMYHAKKSGHNKHWLFSDMQLRDKPLPAGGAQEATRTGRDAHFLELDVSESSLFHLQSDASILTPIELSHMRIHIAIDDLGEGGASLKQLQCFPVNSISLAPRFVNYMLGNRENSLFIKSLIHLGQNLSLRVNAKGIETLAQSDHLEQQGCDGAQGFLFSKPLSATDFLALLGSDRLFIRV